MYLQRPLAERTQDSLYLEDPTQPIKQILGDFIPPPFPKRLQALSQNYFNRLYSPL